MVCLSHMLPELCDHDCRVSAGAAGLGKGAQAEELVQHPSVPSALAASSQHLLAASHDAQVHSQLSQTSSRTHAPAPNYKLASAMHALAQLVGAPCCDIYPMNHYDCDSSPPFLPPTAAADHLHNT